MPGPNGAGKTTSISLMLGLRRPSDGQARLFGLDPADRRARSRCYWSGHHAAPAIANLIYLPLSFASGLFMPLAQLPGFVQALAPYLPSYHYAQLAWSALGAGRESLGVSLLWLGGYTALFLTLAVKAYRREERAKFA
jgi:energy-coupling factor transporter ATP-binding protein EcfA2